MQRFDTGGAPVAPVDKPTTVGVPRRLPLAGRLIARLRSGGRPGATDAERLRVQSERGTRQVNAAPAHALAAGGPPIFLGLRR